MPAGDDRGRAGGRQEPPLRRAARVCRGAAGARALAAGSLPALRRRDLVLGAGRDREGRVRHPRVGHARAGGGEARASRCGAAIRTAPGSWPAWRRWSARRRSRPAQEESFAAWRRFCEGLAAERTDGARVRGPALGRRRPARLPRASGRLGGRRAAAAPVHGAARAVRAASDLRRQRPQRAADQPRSPERRGDRAARLGAAGAGGAAGRDAAGAAGAGRRQSPVRGGVRPSARRPRRPRSRRCRSRCRR